MKTVNDIGAIAWVPELIYAGGRFERGRAMLCDLNGTIVGIPRVEELKHQKQIRLHHRALLPGMVNAHSHAFQRVLRGRTEYRTENQTDSFWTWREMMYSAAARLTPADIYDASRMAFMEMALSGITAVGEFHYLHHAPGGEPFADGNLLAHEVIRAAADAGVRIALLRVAYARSGFQQETNTRQARFIETDPASYLKNLESLIDDLRSSSDVSLPGSPQSSVHGDRTAWAGVAPHSVRAVPLDYLREIIRYANQQNLPVHMHVAEQPAEVSDCTAEYGRTPVGLLASEGLLSERFTAVHAIHVAGEGIAAFGESQATVCACPTTERNLGDGILPADAYLDKGVQICLGTDSHVQIDLLEDARELEYHLRLQRLERAVLGGKSAGGTCATNQIAALLFDCATVHGARSIGAPSGTLQPGKPADFFTLDLNDPSIAGSSDSDLLTSIVFGSSRAAIREVVIGGKPVVSEGQHLLQEDVVDRFNELQKRLWG